MKNPIVIAVDAMGGDNSPKKIIDGIDLYYQKTKIYFSNYMGIRVLLKNH